MYYVYILLCSDNSFYAGCTDNLEERMNNHRSGNGSKYVKERLPFKLIYTEHIDGKAKAYKRERQIKGWRREKKIKVLKLKI